MRLLHSSTRAKAAVGIAGAACLALAGLPTASGLNGSGQAAAATSSAASCPAPNYPHAGDTGPYLLAMSGTGSGSVQITNSPAGPVHLSSVSFKFCGLLELPLNKPIIQPQNITFTSVTAHISRAVLSQTIAGAAASSGGVLPQTGANNGLNLYLIDPIKAGTSLLGVQCSIPVDVDVSTASPGGVPLTGPLNNASATLSGTGFPVNDTYSTGSGGTCPSYLASQVNQTLGLPNTSTSASVTVHINIQVP